MLEEFIENLCIHLYHTCFLCGNCSGNFATQYRPEIDLVCSMDVLSDLTVTADTCKALSWRENKITFLMFDT